jgi:hypothetical protein
MQQYLRPSHFIDSDHPAAVEFAERQRGSSKDPRDQAISLYYARYLMWRRWSSTEAFFFGHLAKVYPHLFGEQSPQMLGDMQAELESGASQ